MSKVSDAKTNQGWTKKPKLPLCVNCKQYSSKFIPIESIWIHKVTNEEKDIRCFLGNFKTSRTCSCLRFELKESV